jgi:RNA polymerase sigma-70 factor (ECF subfamily)
VTGWWKQIVAKVPASARPVLAQDGLGEKVAADLAAVRAKWPEANVTEAQFADALAARIESHASTSAGKDLPAAIGRLRVEDLYLALWCATGDAKAIATFEQVHKADLDAVLARFRRLPITGDELRQTLRIKLFVRTDDRQARIADYSGFGFLQNWLRVTALRALVDIARSEKARKLEELLADEDLGALPELGPDVSAKYSREEIGRAIKHAFAKAVATLAPRQRNFLRHAQVDNLTLDQIAALYSIHRATVARTLASAREELTKLTRKELGDKLGIPEDALDSVVRAADSRLDLSLSRVLKAPELADSADADADPEPGV